MLFFIGLSYYMVEETKVGYTITNSQDNSS